MCLSHMLPILSPESIPCQEIAMRLPSFPYRPRHASSWIVLVLTLAVAPTVLGA